MTLRDWYIITFSLIGFCAFIGLVVLAFRIARDRRYRKDAERFMSRWHRPSGRGKINP